MIRGLGLRDLGSSDLELKLYVVGCWTVVIYLISGPHIRNLVFKPNGNFGGSIGTYTV